MKIFVIIFFLLVAISMYLIIVGGNMNKTNVEIEMENEEEMRFLENYRKKKEAKDEKKIVK